MEIPAALAWSRDRFGSRDEIVLDLACHAALPVALNSELLHLIRLNFFHAHEHSNGHSRLDYAVEAELLLSPLCREISEDLYEILPEIRLELLKRLYHRYPGNIESLSVLIARYTQSCADWLALDTLKKSQWLTALQHLDRDQAKQLIAAQQLQLPRLNPAEKQEKHEWLVAMRGEVELGEIAAKAVTQAIFVMHDLPAAKPWRARPELDALVRQWQENPQGLFLISGAAEIGKTALLAEFFKRVSAALASENSRPIFVYSFHESPHIPGFIKALGAWLKKPHASFSEILQTLAERGGLLLLDGLDTFQDSGEWRGIPGHVTDWRLAELLQQIGSRAWPGVSAVIASRYALPGEAFTYQHIVLHEAANSLPPSFRDTLKDGTPGPEMVFLSGGTFKMGDQQGIGDKDRERPVHEVTLSAFLIGKYPVTVGEFRRFVDATGYKTEAEIGDGSGIRDRQRNFNQIKDANWRNPYFEQHDNYPVVCITWNDAQAYCVWLSEQADQDYRLLTEAEWEYACRAESDTAYCFGNDEKQLVKYAWYGENSSNRTHPVGEKKANKFGLHDLHGNIWEWVGDWYGKYLPEPQGNPSGSDSGFQRVNRGGSWSTIHAKTCRSSVRHLIDPSSRFDNLGFRLARGRQRAGPEQDPAGGSKTGQVLRALRESNPWAERIERDEYGVYADFNYKKISQRMRLILPGRLMMGSPKTERERYDDEQQHEVILTQPFWLADTACTQALWRAVMGDNPSRFTRMENPVETVSWNDAQRFLSALNQAMPGLNLRLPSEAEWEYACRAGTTTPFWFGENITPEQVNYDGNYPYAGGKKGVYRKTTVPVKALPCNAWGLYQMHGNVWEWCQDGYGSYQLADSSPVSDPVGADRSGYCVMRGGSWSFHGRFVRSASRYWHSPNYRIGNFGFRLARGHIGPGYEL